MRLIALHVMEVSAHQMETEEAKVAAFGTFYGYLFWFTLRSIFVFKCIKIVKDDGLVCRQ